VLRLGSLFCIVGEQRFNVIGFNGDNGMDLYSYN